MRLINKVTETPSVWNLPPDFQLVSAKHIVLERSSDDLSCSYWHSPGSEAFFVTWELFHVFSVLLKNDRVCRRPHKASSVQSSGFKSGAWAPVTGKTELLRYEHLAPVMNACADRWAVEGDPRAGGRTHAIFFGLVSIQLHKEKQSWWRWGAHGLLHAN